MEGGSNSEMKERVERQKGLNPKIEPFVPKKEDFDSGRDLNVRNESAGFDLERGVDKTETVSPKIELDPILGRARNRGVEIEPVLGSVDEGLRNVRGRGRGENLGRRVEMEPILRAHNEERKDAMNENENDNSANGAVNGNGHTVSSMLQLQNQGRMMAMWMKKWNGCIFDGEDPSYGGWHQSPWIKCGLRENLVLVSTYSASSIVECCSCH
ncbi:hypothetical protein HAX54_004763 [Datura stramonium]|uniref:Uncharacterized protein n=1 Tax=Datura stramonium TaxID=4076 RepID=A0ABS8T946_DATST|nr:hypothetical protein [Datura stramonium]